MYLDSDLDEAKMKEKARLFHDSFLSKLSLLLKGMVVAPPDRFGGCFILCGSVPENLRFFLVG
jgi:hypothetical protein